MSKMRIFIIVYLAFAIGEHLTISAENTNVQNPANATISYTLWVGSNIIPIDTLDFTVPDNSTFYSVMELAAEKNAIYNFETIVYPNMGHYITSIAGYDQDKSNNIYWMIYNLTSFPDLWSPPKIKQLSPVGVDSLIVQDGHHYLFWFQYVNIVKPDVYSA